MTTRAKTVHRLKVTLRQVKPPIWRRIEVLSDVKLSELSDVLEAAMGWYGGHLHAFEAGGVHYEMPDPDGFGFNRPVDERKARLGEVLPTVGSKMRWDYDFGDGWEHDVLVEAIEPRRAEVTYPVCLAGKRACPPEDCGGPWGYGNLLAALGDPTHPEHDELTEWAPPGFDPAAFDAGEVTEDMRAARPLKGW
ncbi:MAG: plasmid pRiA4b ORF-3 family protein [Acidimicrobiia bacterium]